MEDIAQIVILLSIIHTTEERIMCDNMVSYYVPKGWDYKEIKTRCGNTAHDGSRAICDECLADKRKMENIHQQEENIAADNAWAKSAGWGEF